MFLYLYKYMIVNICKFIIQKIKVFDKEVVIGTKGDKKVYGNVSITS